MNLRHRGTKTEPLPQGLVDRACKVVVQRIAQGDAPGVEASDRELAQDPRLVPVRGIASGTYHHNKPWRTARYRIFDIDASGVRGDHVRVWDREAGTFSEPGPDDGTVRQS